jgi:hypothetical protein
MESLKLQHSDTELDTDSETDSEVEEEDRQPALSCQAHLGANQSYGPSAPCPRAAVHVCRGVSGTGQPCGLRVCSVHWHEKEGAWVPPNIQCRCSGCYFYIMSQRDSENFWGRP